MLKPISFCINTSRNEREYLLLLLNSLKENTQIENMRFISRKRITENYTWEKITNQYIELLKKMLKSKSC